MKIRSRSCRFAAKMVFAGRPNKVGAPPGAFDHERKNEMVRPKNEIEAKKIEEQLAEEDEIDKSEAPEESLTDQEIDLGTTEAETNTQESIPSELKAINTDNETAKELRGYSEKAKAQPKKTKSAKLTKKRSQKYQKVRSEVDPTKQYKLEEAIELVKKTSYSKFDGTVSLSIRLEKSKKSDEAVRGTIRLPNGTGKKLKVEVASDEIIEKIKKGYTGFDILVATPAIMPKLAQVAKTLGPIGKMPNPKDQTVVEKPEEVISDLSEKIARYRADIGRNIHIAVGKVSWESEKIAENISAVLKALFHLKKESATIGATMSPAVKIEIK